MNADGIMYINAIFLIDFIIDYIDYVKTKISKSLLNT